jgi:hypothetical protein
MEETQFIVQKAFSLTIGGRFTLRPIDGQKAKRTKGQKDKRTKGQKDKRTKGQKDNHQLPGSFHGAK